MSTPLHTFFGPLFTQPYRSPAIVLGDSATKGLRPRRRIRSSESACAGAGARTRSAFSALLAQMRASVEWHARRDSKHAPAHAEKKRVADILGRTRPRRIGEFAHPSEELGPNW